MPFSQYPSVLFYLNYTSNLMRFSSIRKLGLLQFGIVDSNNSGVAFDYLINANEKSSTSYLFFLNTLYLQGVIFLNLQKKTFLFTL